MNSPTGRLANKSSLIDSEKSSVRPLNDTTIVFLNDSDYKYFIIARDISRLFEYLFQTHFNATCVDVCVCMLDMTIKSNLCKKVFLKKTKNWFLRPIIA